LASGTPFANTDKEKRQNLAGSYFFQGMSATQKLPISNPASSTKLKPVLFTQATRERTIWGPFTLNPANVRFSYSVAGIEYLSLTIEKG
jgi:hypothetical protein